MDVHETQKINSIVNFQEIEDRVFDGLSEACGDAYRFSGEINAQIEPEYIITTNIAKSLNEINSKNKSFGSPLIIKIEEDTSVFASECVPLVIWKDIFDSKHRRNHNAERNGKIDIAVYEVSYSGSLFENRIPKCPIEVKKFAPSRREILKDLLRNLEYLQVKDNTGHNRIEKAYLAFLAHDFDCIFQVNKEKGITRIKSMYLAMVKGFSDSLKELELSLRIEVKTVNEFLFKDNSELKDKDEEYISGRIAESFHHVGILIIIERIVKTK